jgi:hypothetical protein
VIKQGRCRNPRKEAGRAVRKKHKARDGCGWMIDAI